MLGLNLRAYLFWISVFMREEMYECLTLKKHVCKRALNFK